MKKIILIIVLLIIVSVCTSCNTTPSDTQTSVSPTVVPTAVDSTIEPVETQEQTPQVTKTPEPTPTPMAPVSASVGIDEAYPALSFSRPLYFATAGDGSGYCYVVEQTGKILVFEDSPDADEANVFLDPYRNNRLRRQRKRSARPCLSSGLCRKRFVLRQLHG